MQNKFQHVRGCLQCHRQFSNIGGASGAGRRRASEVDTVLVRDFIQKSLYGSRKDRGGYFGRDVIASLSAPLKFGSFWGEGDYRKAVHEAHRMKPGAWLTPVEIFSPHFSNAIASYLLKQYNKRLESGEQRKDLKIYEIGGGTGTNAVHILNFLKDRAPDVYARTSYTLIEISPFMADAQRKKIGENHPEKAKVINEGLLEWCKDGSRVIDEQECFFLGFEVLDNTPHDKIAYQDASKDSYEAAVVLDPIEPQEVMRLLQDHVIKRLLHLCPQLSERLFPPRESSMVDLMKAVFFEPKLEYSAAFVPTGALLLIDVLAKSFPKHHAVLADFDQLPLPRLPPGEVKHPTLVALNSPIVCSSDPETRVLKDHATYLVPNGTADIYFPTDFDILKQMYTQVCSRDPTDVRVMKQNAFLASHADIKQTRTRSGYNPLLRDFTNTSMLLS